MKIIVSDSFLVCENDTYNISVLTELPILTSFVQLFLVLIVLTCDVQGLADLRERLDSWLGVWNCSAVCAALTLIENEKRSIGRFLLRKVSTS